MEIFHLANECDAVQFCIKYKPRRCVKFKRKNETFATWIVIAGIGELYTHKSLRKSVGHRYLLTYDFFEKSFSGVAYEQKKDGTGKA